MKQHRFTEQELAFLDGLRIPCAVFQLVDGKIVTLALSEGFRQLFGYTDRQEAMDFMNRNMYKDTHPDDVERITEAARAFIRNGGRYEVVFRARTRDRADYRIIHAQGEHIMTDTGVRLGQVWYTDEGPYEEGEDTSGTGLNSQLSAALHEESILRGSYYDRLTGLPNLAYFFELAETEKVELRSRGEEATLVYADLNGMKYYNYSNGFAEGDRLLRYIGRVMADIFGAGRCCHIGADRFAAVAREKGLEDDIQRLIQRVAEYSEGKPLPLRVGIYPGSLEDVPVSTAYDRAKVACDALQRSEKSAFKFFTAELSEKEKLRRYIQENIDRAIAEKWITVYYQPIVRAVSQRVCDEESLARWIDPEKGFLSPAEFIPQLEETGQIYKLDLCVLEQTLEKIRRTKQAGLHMVPHSINLSRKDFDACDIVEEIRSRVDASGIPREMITIEITESVIGRDPEFMKQQIIRFRNLGFPVWMDDFGSGYSSLDVLQTIPFDLIKFDMSFLRKLDEGENGKIILTELMRMATALGVDTVCEGVETKEQLRFLEEIGCSKLQGYYFTKPLPFESILERYQSGKQIGYENPAESAYYETIGRVNLYDLAMISSQDENVIHNAFNTIPMGIIEVNEDSTRFTRSNPSYREFIRRFYGLDLSAMGPDFVKYGSAFMRNIVQTCCEQGGRTFYDEKMPDGSVVHSFARKVSTNPVTGSVAVSVAVLSVASEQEGATYAEIARALASDYYNIYVVDLDEEEKFIEYTSAPGRSDLAVERHGTDFFATARRDTMTRIYKEDQAFFLAWFTKENVIAELDAHGFFTTTYRLVDTGEPMFVNMKITRLQGSNRIILGVSIIDAQMKHLRSRKFSEPTN